MRLILLSLVQTLLPPKSQSTVINNINVTINHNETVIEQHHEGEASPAKGFVFEEASPLNYRELFGQFTKLTSADEEICKWLDNRIPKKPEK